MVFKIRNSKIIVLMIILIISTGLATIIQFIKGALFESAIDMNGTDLGRLVLILGLLIVSEVFFYYLEWRYENSLTRRTIAEQKKGIVFQSFRIKKFNHINDDIDSKSNLLINVVDSLEYNYYAAYFESIYLLFRILFVTISLLYINFFMGLIIFISMFIPLGVTKIFKNKVSKLEKDYLEQKGDNLNLYKNIFDNLKQIRILNARDLFYGKIRDKIEEERKKGQVSKEYRLRMNSFYSFFSYMLHFFTLAVSVILVYRGDIKPGMMITLLGLIEQLSMPVLSLSRNINDINSTKQLRNDIDAAMKLDREDDRQIKLQNKMSVNGLKVAVGDQIIGYKDIEFISGKKYLIEGTSGIGKSVYLNAITGLLNTKEGKILYDGVELTENENPLEEVFLVLADSNLFKQNGIFNILLKEDCTEDERVYMESFLTEEQLMKEDAINLSSGEKRRILNLRGLMSERQTLIFDEPVANLDEKNSDKFWAELLKQDKTIIVVSHDAPDWVREEFDEILDFKNYAQ